MSEQTCYSYYEIDAGDIWHYERSEYAFKRRTREQMDELYEYLQKFHLGAKHEPEYANPNTYNSPTEEPLYERYLNEWKHRADSEIMLGFFYYKRQFIQFSRRLHH